MYIVHKKKETIRFLKWMYISTKKKKKDKIPQKDVNRFKDSYIIHKRM